jgi:hypothetical protein
MKIISHRGNLKGPDPKNENTIKQIDIALKKSFDVEIDLWKINDKFFLGHDKPDNEVELDWLEKRKNKLWIHAKNFSAIESLKELNQGLFFFYYKKEPLVLISNQKIWCHNPEKIHNPSNFIIPILENVNFTKYNLNSYYGICTDYPNDLFYLIN